MSAVVKPTAVPKEVLAGFWKLSDAKESVRIEASYRMIEQVKVRVNLHSIWIANVTLDSPPPSQGISHRWNGHHNVRLLPAETHPRSLLQPRVGQAGLLHDARRTAPASARTPERTGPLADRGEDGQGEPDQSRIEERERTRKKPRFEEPVSTLFLFCPCRRRENSRAASFSATALCSAAGRSRWRSAGASSRPS